MKNHFLLLWGLIALIITSGLANAVTYSPKLRMGSLSAGEMPEFSNQVGLDGVENIRLATGTLNLVHTDISMPVSADLSIDIIRYYTSPAKVGFSSSTTVENSYLGGKSALGIGWDIHMGRILNADYDKNLGFCQHEVQSDPNARFRGPVLELANGSRQELFNSKATGEGAVEFPLITPDYWVAECTTSATIIAYSPDGKKYTFGEYANIKDHEHPVLNLTRVEDKNGNYYTVSYKNVSAWNTDDVDNPTFTIRSIDRITAQDGREIIFKYDVNGRLTGVSTPTQTWIYTHEAEANSGYENDSYLMSVTGPEGYKWQYDYVKSGAYPTWVDPTTNAIDNTGWYAVPGMFGMSKIITPYGAQVDYEYYARAPVTGTWPRTNVIGNGEAELAAIAKKTITGAGIDAPRVWKYKVDNASIVYDDVLKTYTWGLDDTEIAPYVSDISNDEKLGSIFYRIEGPDRIEIHQFCHHDGASTSQEYGWMCVDLEGRSLSTRVFNKKLNPDGTENIAEVELVEEISYERTFHENITDEFKWNSPIGYAFPVDVQVSITRGTEIFNTLTTTFDKFYNPLLIDEFTGTPLTAEQLRTPDPITGKISIPEEPGRIRRQTLNTYINVEDKGTTVVGDEKWRIGFLESSKLADFTDSSGKERAANIFNSYDVYGNIISSKKHNAETRYTYTQVSTDGGLTYHPTGNIETITDPLNKVTTFSNYKFGIPQNERLHNGDTISRVVDNAGNITSYTNGRGFITSFTYDFLDRVKTIETPRLDDNNISLTYAWVGVNFQQTIGTYIEKIKLDGLGNLLEEDKGGIITTQKYDLAGRLSFSSYPNSLEGVSTQYDSLGRVLKQTHTADGSSVVYNYLSNNVLSVTDEELKETIYTYRAFSNPDQKDLISIEQKSVGESIVTDIKRTQRGDILDVIQGKSVGAYNGLTTSLVETKEHIKRYDANYFNDQHYFPEEGTTGLARNLVGNIETKTLYSLSTSPHSVATYIYDDLHRLKTIDYSLGTPDVTYTYNANNNIEKIVNGNVVLDYTFDENDNLKTETLTVDGNSYTLSYAYDANNALSQTIYPDGLIVDYLPNALGQPTQASGFVNNVLYHPNGQLKSLNYNNGQVLSIDQDARLFTGAIASGTTASLAYTYDKTGNAKTINDIIDPSYNLTLGYDDYHQLTTANGKWGNGSISYNAHGDITQKTIGATDLVYSYHPTTFLLNSVTGGTAGKYSLIEYDVFNNISYNGLDAFVYNDAADLVSVSNKGLAYTYDGNKYRVMTVDGGYKNYMQYSLSGTLAYEFDPQKQLGKSYIRIGNVLVARQDNFAPCTALDTDLDGISDCDEYRIGMDPTINDTLQDKDLDGLTNLQEFNLGTDINNADTDGDTIDDKFEVDKLLDPLDPADALLDKDLDGLSNLQEYQIGTKIDNADSDTDTLSDSFEVANGLNPLKIDSDDDGMPDDYEVTYGLNALVNDALLDLDTDGVTNINEFNLGLAANNPDTDGDTLTDGFEIANNLRADLPDTDGDGLDDGYEIANNLRADLKDTDGDGLEDGFEVANGMRADSKDSDGDLIEDDYEIANNLNPLLDDSQLDLDGDGFTNYEEFLAGTSANNIADIPSGNLRWTMQFSHLATVPVSNKNGTLFLADNDHMVAVQPDNTVAQQTILWSTPLPGTVSASPAIGLNGSIYALYTTGVAKAGLVSVSPTGEVQCSVLFKQNIGTRVSPAIGLDGNIYVASMARTYYGVSNPVTQGTMYVVSSDCKILSETDLAENVVENPAIDLDGNFNMLHDNADFSKISSTGTVLQNILSPLFSSTYEMSGVTPGLYTNRYFKRTSLYVIRNNGTYQAFSDAMSRVFSKPLIMNFTTSPNGEILTLSEFNESVRSLDATNGTVRWSYTLGSDNHPEYALLGDNSMVYVASAYRGVAGGGNHKITALKIANNVATSLWEYPLTYMAKGLSMYTNGDIYALDISGKLYSITSASNGLQDSLWPTELKDMAGRNNGCIGNTTDTDTDLISDCYENQFGLNANDINDAVLDLDGDGLSNLQEFNLLTQANQIDSDQDGLLDGDELTNLTDPLNKDSDYDGMHDGYEVLHGLDPKLPDATGDLDLDSVSNLFEFSMNSSASDALIIPGEGVIKWQVQANAMSAISPVMLTVDGSMYFTDANGLLHKLDATGTALWSLDVSAGAILVNDGPGVAPDGKLYISRSGQVVSVTPDGLVTELIFDIASINPGETLKFKPTIGSNGLLYMVDTVGNMYVVDTVAKSLVYTEDLRPRKVVMIELERPVIDEVGNVIIGDPNTRSIHIWNETSRSANNITSDLLPTSITSILPIGNQTVLVSSDGSTTIKVAYGASKASLTSITSTQPKDSGSLYIQNFANPISGNDTIFGGVDGFVVASESSALEWRHILQYNSPVTVTPAATTDGRIFIAKDNTLYAFMNQARANLPEENLQLLWKRSFVDNIEQILIDHTGHLYISSATGQIVKITITGSADGNYWMMQGHDAQRSYNVSTVIPLQVNRVQSSDQGGQYVLHSIESDFMCRANFSGPYFELSETLSELFNHHHVSEVIHQNMSMIEQGIDASIESHMASLWTQ